MKNAKIVRVAEWDGWCGACGAERPLVLTRTGRQRMRTWLTAAGDDSCPLVLTCRLCGTGVDVPLERDDPPVVLSTDEPSPTVAAASVVAVEVPVTAMSVPAPVMPAELTAGRQVVAQALGALLAQRSTQVSLSKTPVLEPTSPVQTPLLAPAVPVQRTPSPVGLAELQLLADGIDLLSTGRP